MKNRGFTIIEGLFCIMLLSSILVGGLSLLSYFRFNQTKKYYELMLANNHYAIFSIFEGDPLNARVKIKELYTYIEEEDGSLTINVPLEKKYQSADEIKFNIVFIESTDYYIMNVKVIGVLEYYEKINIQTVSERKIPK